MLTLHDLTAPGADRAAFETWWDRTGTRLDPNPRARALALCAWMHAWAHVTRALGGAQ